MSHVDTIEVQVKDLEALVEAIATLGTLEFKRGQRTYRWYGRSVGDYPLPAGISKNQLGKCEHAISVKGNPNAYEIGLVRVGDHWELLWDFWQGGYGLEACVGKKAEKLVEAYTKAATIRATKAFAKAKGWTYTQKVDPQTQETVLLLRQY